MGIRSTDRSSKGFGTNKLLDGHLLSFFRTLRSGGGSNKTIDPLVSINTFTSPGTLSIPAGTVRVRITAHGVSNPIGPVPSQGIGGYSQGTFTTLAGNTLNVNFGGAGEWAEYVGRGSNYAGVFNGPVAHANSLIIAGGAGGFGFANWGYGVIGSGGGTTGGNGSPGIPGNSGSWPNDGPSATGSSGSGGTQSAGGNGGAAGALPMDPYYTPYPGNPGSALQGGPAQWKPGSGNLISQAAAGGGGYYGGGAGGTGSFSPGSHYGQGGWGGGGSGYIHPTATSTTSTTGGATSPGTVIIEYYYF
jgi:hypothetical protein